MATISFRNGKFRASIRKKNRELTATFSDKTTAEIWSRYHEEIIDNLENFQIPAENLITLEECLDLKIEEIKQRNLPKRTISDYEMLKYEFKDLMPIPLGEITVEMIKDITKEKSNEIVRVGGHAATNSGSMRITSRATILRKLRCLSACIGYMIQKGAAITNVAQVVVNQVKMSMIKKGESLEQAQDE